MDLCIFNKWNYACLAKWDMQVKYMFKCKLKVTCKLSVCLNASWKWYASYACLCKCMDAYASHVYV